MTPQRRDQLTIARLAGLYHLSAITQHKPHTQDVYRRTEERIRDIRIDTIRHHGYARAIDMFGLAGLMYRACQAAKAA